MNTLHHSNLTQGTQKKRPLAQINVVPYIDVMLVLLVIFMITTPLLKQSIQVNLPTTQAQILNPKAYPPIVITIDRTEHYYLNLTQHPKQPINKLILVNLVIQALHQHNSRPVLIKADRQVAYGQVVQIMALLKQSGVHSVGLVTQHSTS